MKGTLSFHPVELAFFDETVAPLASGRKIDPEPFLAEAIRVRKIHWQVRRYTRAIETVLAVAGPPPPPDGAGLWGNVKAYLEKFDWRPDDLTKRVLQSIDPDLHLYGRPFFVAEASAAKVVETVDRYRGAPSPGAAEAIAKEQIARLDPELSHGLAPEDGPDLCPDSLHRADLLGALARIHEIASAARAGRVFTDGQAEARPAVEVLRDEMPWRAVSLHARIVPFWTARGVDGLETICRAARVLAPDSLVPAWRLFAGACDEFPDLKASLHQEVKGERDVGAFVAPQDVPRLLDFLNAEGARIIEAAARQDEGRACATLLHKIRECAAYAVRHGLGYLEASGILPPDLEEGFTAGG